MKVSLTICIIAFLAIGCTHAQNCIDNINKLPMYGNVKKCPDQIAADQEFLKTADKSYKNRKEAAAHMVMRGWEYFYKKQLDTSMMRFNQAWLLDTLNAEIYWGFANILGSQKNFKGSLSFFNKALKLNPNNGRVWQDVSVSYGNLFVKSQNKVYLDSSIYSLKKAAKIDPHNPQIYAQLTAAYCYFVQKDSARKYLKITEQIDPKAINPEIKKLLSSNK